MDLRQSAGGGGGGGPHARFPSPIPASTSSSRPESTSHSPPQGVLPPLLVLPSHSSSSSSNNNSNPHNSSSSVNHHYYNNRNYGSTSGASYHHHHHYNNSRPPTAIHTPALAPTPTAMSPPSPTLGATLGAASPAAASSAAAVSTAIDDVAGLDLALTMRHDHKDLVQVVAFNTYGDRCATGSVDGKIRVFNRSRDDVWRLCDRWGGHGGEVLELQWLPATVYPNLIASLGIEGRFKLWAEDPSAAPGKRFHNGGSRTADGKPAFETRSSTPRLPYRSFSMRHSDDTRTTHLALLTVDGRMTVLESDEPERIADCATIDEFSVISPTGRKPARGEEVSFKVRFDPNPEPCYAALGAGVGQDSLAMVVACMDTVKIFRSRDVEVRSAYGGAPHIARRFYCVADVAGHHGLVRDVSWAWGNIRGYDLVASACSDGLVRVLRIETPNNGPAKDWTVAEVTRPPPPSSDPSRSKQQQQQQPQNQQQQQQQQQHLTGNQALQSFQYQLSGISASLAQSGNPATPAAASSDNRFEHPPGGVVHVATEISRLDCHGAPVWRVAFNDDGMVLGSAGDDGRLILYRQRPDETWAKSSELGLAKAHMAAPPGAYGDA